jgi:hypothetical protein
MRSESVYPSSEARLSELEPSEVPPPPAGKKVEREGLPSGYRMRADSHYVDQLSARRIEHDAPRASAKRAVDPADADSTAVDRREARETKDAKDARDRRTERLLSQLLVEVDALAASASLLSPGGAAALSQRANVAAVRAHAFRAAWLLRAHALVDGGHRVQVRPRFLARVLEQVREALTAECGLTGLHLDIHATDANTPVPMDDAALLTGIAGGVFTLAALLPDSSGATIRINATAHGGELRTVEIAQDETTVAPNVSTLFFDQQWNDRPGGAVASLAAACVKAVAALHGGDAVFMPGARRGSTIRFNFHRQIN